MGDDKNYYLIDFFLEKLDPKQQSHKVINLYLRYKDRFRFRKMTYDEKGNDGFGYWCRKLARDEYDLSLPLEPLKCNKDKVSHFDVHVPHFKAKRVFLPRSHPFVERLIDQLVYFPDSKIEDDGVDMMSSLLDNFKDKVAPSVYFG